MSFFSAPIYCLEHILLLRLNTFTAVTGNSSLTAHCHSSCDVPQWPTTNVWRVVSTAWCSPCTYCGSGMWCNSWLSTVLYWRRVGGCHDVTSRRRDVSDSVQTVNVFVDDRVVIHLTYEWSSTDTRQIQQWSATYSWRSWRQTTMSHGCFIPVTLMTTSSGLSVSVLYRRIVEDHQQTTYMMLSRYVTPVTASTTYNTYIALCYMMNVHEKISKNDYLLCH